MSKNKTFVFSTNPWPYINNPGTTNFDSELKYLLENHYSISTTPNSQGYYYTTK